MSGYQSQVWFGRLAQQALCNFTWEELQCILLTSLLLNDGIHVMQPMQAGSGGMAL